MRLFEIGNTTIKCSPVLFIIIPFVIFFNAVGEMLTALLSLSLHEACHTLVARGLGYRVSSIEIQPFGFVARLETMMFSPIDEIAIAVAGPVCSLVIAAVASAFFKSTPGSLHAFAQCNLALGAINLSDARYPLAFICVVEGGGYGASACVPVMSTVLAECKAIIDAGY